MTHIRNKIVIPAKAEKVHMQMRKSQAFPLFKLPSGWTSQSVSPPVRREGM
jgi:hypothetical protein